MTHRGFTLHELLISMTVLGGVLGLAAHLATSQLRFFTSVSETASATRQRDDASGVVASVLWSVSPASGDIVAAMDSALEIESEVGSAVTCAALPGAVVIPAPPGAGNALGAWFEPPKSGDRVHALFDDSLGISWLTLHAAGPPVTGGSCAPWGIADAWTLGLRETLPLPEGTPLRFTRPLRLSLYHASDGYWYMGAKDWNADQGRFNTIQPVAGPLRPYSPDKSRTGLAFVYRDRAGVQLQEPVTPARIASITILSRAAVPGSARFPGLPSAAYGGQDSGAVTVALRNAQ